MKAHDENTYEVVVVDRSDRVTKRVKVKDVADRHVAVRVVARDLLVGERVKTAKLVK